MSELERWESRFAAPGYLFGTAPNAFLASQAHRLRPGQKTLALADGEGRNGVSLDCRKINYLEAAPSPCPYSSHSYPIDFPHPEHR
jgi:hypothetical protein